MCDSPNCKEMNLQSPTEMFGPHLTKRCPRCRETKSLSEFNRHRGNPDGLQRYCKSCQSKATARWQTENRDKANATAMRYYYGRGKQYVEEHREEIEAYRKEWFVQNPLKRREYKRAYRARQLGSNEHFTQEEFDTLCERYDNRCLSCGTTDGLEADHVVALINGGLDGIENIQPLCRSCNATKGTLTIDLRV